MTNRTIATTLAAATSVVGLGFGMVATAPAAHAAPAPVQTVAVYGHTSAAIRTLQQNLIKLGYLGEGLNTGYYGDATKAAVQHYEAAHKLPSTTGVSSTLYAQIAKDAAKKPSTTSTSSTSLDKRCLTGARVLCVHRDANTMYLVENGKVKDSFTVRVGKGQYATRKGSFQIYDKIPNAWSRLYRVRMPLSLPFDNGIYVHYSQQFHDEAVEEGFMNAAKHNSSHGCVNVGSYSDQQRIYNTMRIGDKVVVY